MAADESRAICELLGGATIHSVGRATDMGIVELADLGGRSIAIHIQCPFRLLRDEVLVLGSRDMRYPQAGAGSQAFDNFRTIFDLRAKSVNVILERLRPSVVDVSVTAVGNLAVWGESNFRLETFPDCSGVVEAWRVLVRNGEHYVFPPEAE